MVTHRPPFSHRPRHISAIDPSPLTGLLLRVDQVVVSQHPAGAACIALDAAARTGTALNGGGLHG